MNFGATKGFQKWATGFSGCDGGNINGPIWFCGIEYGGGEDKYDFKFDDVTSPSYVPEEKLWDHLKYQYNRKMAKIYAQICGRTPPEYYENARDRGLMSADGDVFKMNLFPIAFPRDHNELWEEWIYNETGLPTKSIYRAWCQVHRFVKIQQWVSENSPKLIVATSVNYEADFMMAFGGVNTIYDKQSVENETILDRRLVWLPVNSGKTILAITPFLGYRYGLNSDALQAGFGARLNEICATHFGKDWLVT